MRDIYPKISVNGIELHVLHESPNETAMEFFTSTGNYRDDYPLDGE